MKRVLVLFLLCVLVGCNTTEDSNLVGAESYIVPIPVRGADRTPLRLGMVQTAKLGDVFVYAFNYEYYKPFSPRKDAFLKVPFGTSPIKIERGQKWAATHRFGDKDLLLKAPASLSPSGYELALRVDKNGNVKGDKPWFDLKTNRRFVQESWEGSKGVFKIGKTEPKEKLEVKMEYVEFRGCKEEIDKCFGAIRYSHRAPDEPERVPPLWIVDNGDRIRFWDAEVEIVGFTDDTVQYMVKKYR